MDEDFHPGDVVTMDLIGEWLRHPVTKVLGLLIAAEIARQLILRHGASLLGLIEEAADETGKV